MRKVVRVADRIDEPISVDPAGGGRHQCDSNGGNPNRSSACDAAHGLRNGFVRSGPTLEGVRWAFTTTWLANWHPLTWVSYLLDVSRPRRV